MYCKDNNEHCGRKEEEDEDLRQERHQREKLIVTERMIRFLSDCSLVSQLIEDVKGKDGADNIAHNDGEREKESFKEMRRRYDEIRAALSLHSHDNNHTCVTWPLLHRHFQPNFIL